MKTLNSLVLILLLGSAAIAKSLASTDITIEINNYTTGNLKMTDLSTSPPPPPDLSLDVYDVDPRSIRNINFAHERNYTRPGPDWQPTLKKVKPIELVLSYELHNSNFECQLHTRFIAPIGFGALAPSYRPDWTSRTAYTGDGKYTCRSEIARRMLEPPFSYTVRLIVE